MTMLVLRNATAILPDREAHDASVIIDGDRIATVETRESVKGDNEIDLSHCVLFPGFIDVHNHGSIGIDVMDASESDLHKVSHYLVSQGVTGWVPTLVPSSDDNYAQVAQMIQRAMQDSSKGARVLGIHYEGPFVNTAQCGALHSNHFKTYAGPDDLDPLRLPATGVRMITLAPEVEGGVALVSELNSRGWVISIGHTRAALELLNEVFEGGARHMTHFMNAMAPLHHRNPGPIGWGLSRDDVTCDIIADGVHLDPVILKLLMRVKGSRGLSLISDSIAAAGKGDGEYQIWGETIAVRDGRTSNSAGSIAGSVISMLDAVKMMRSVGASDVEVARMASTNPARLLRISDRCGSIEVGKNADLVAVDAAGSVVLTIVGGEVVYKA